MAKIRILQGMFLITSLFMAFLYINNPFQEIQSLAVIVDFFGLSAAFLFICSTHFCFAACFEP